VSYLAFLTIFLLPPLLVAAVAARVRGLPPRVPAALTLMVAVALAWTTPWDNYLVAGGVWSYGPGRVLGVIGYVPVEEYLFFVLQPLLAGLWTGLLLGPDPEPAPPGPAVAPAVAWLVVTAAGVALAVTGAATYLGLILLWAGPALAFQRLAGGRVLAARRRLRLLAIGVPTLYLWAADAFAIRDGIWRIAPEATIGVGAGGLPLEEAVFFLLTNVLVVDGILLVIAGRMRLGRGRVIDSRRARRGRVPAGGDDA
jgi:lycopene cyclase domain-containing protein